MKKRKLSCLIAVTCLLFTALGSPKRAEAADATVGVDVATAYVFRGVAVNDSWVMQPYFEVAGFPGWFEGLSVGTWGNFDLHDGRGGSPESGEFSEIDFYGTYALPLGIDPVALSLGYTEYTYPNSDLSADREVNVVIEVDTLLQPSLGVYAGVDGGIDEQVYFELGVGHEHELDESFSASLGGTLAWLVQPKDSTADDGLSYAAISAGLSYSILSLSVTQFFETDDEVTTVDKETVGMLGVSYDF